MKKQPFWRQFHLTKPWWSEITDGGLCQCSCGDEHYSPDTRAWRLLIEHLNRRQLEQFRKKRHFTVRGRTRRWRLDFGGDIAVWRTKSEVCTESDCWGECGLAEEVGWDTDVCIDLSDGSRYSDSFPEGDKLLAAKIAIELDDVKFYKVGVSHELSEWNSKATEKKRAARTAAQARLNDQRRRADARRRRRRRR